MTPTRPETRLPSIEADLDRLRGEVDDRMAEPVDPAEDGRAWGVILRGANAVFGRILELDLEARKSALAEPIDYDPELDAAIRQLLADWHHLAGSIAPHADRARVGDDSFEDVDAFRDNLVQAGAILTPDDEFFGGDELVELQDRAIDEHLAGLTEPMHVDGRRSAERRE